MRADNASNRRQTDTTPVPRRVDQVTDPRIDKIVSGIEDPEETDREDRVVQSKRGASYGPPGPPPSGPPPPTPGSAKLVHSSPMTESYQQSRGSDNDLDERDIHPGSSRISMDRALSEPLQQQDELDSLRRRGHSTESTGDGFVRRETIGNGNDIEAEPMPCAEAWWTCFENNPSSKEAS